MKEVVELLEDFSTKFNKILEDMKDRDAAPVIESDEYIAVDNSQHSKRLSIIESLMELLSDNQVKSVAIFAITGDSGVKSSISCIDDDHSKHGELIRYLSTTSKIDEELKSYIHKAYGGNPDDFQEFLAGYEKKIEQEEVGYVSPATAFLGMKSRNGRQQ